MRRWGAVIGATAAALIAAAAPAPAPAATPQIVHQCELGRHLCRVGADGRGAVRLTSSRAFRMPVRTPGAPGITYTQGTNFWRADAAFRRRQRLAPTADIAIATDRRSAVRYLGQGAVGAWVTESLPLGKDAQRCCFVTLAERNVVYPGGERLYAIGEAIDGQSGICLFVLDRDKRCARRVTDTTPIVPSAFDVSADERLVVAALSDDRDHAELAVFDTATGHRLRTLTRGHQDGAPAISPDGRLVAFERDAEPVSGPQPATIGVVSIRGGRVRAVARRGGAPAWVGR